MKFYYKFWKYLCSIFILLTADVDEGQGEAGSLTLTVMRHDQLRRFRGIVGEGVVMEQRNGAFGHAGLLSPHIVTILRRCFKQEIKYEI